MFRFHQENKRLAMDELPVQRTTKEDVDTFYFQGFFEKTQGKTVSETGLPFLQLLENLNLAYKKQLNLTGLLCFGTTPQNFKPDFHVRATSFRGDKVEADHYISDRKMEGKLSVIFASGMDFLKVNLHSLQSGESFNSPAQLEISDMALEEALVNALLHRDYSISAPIYIRVYRNFVEIISPGILPNHLNVAKIETGISNARNSTLLSRASQGLLPYKGLGSGIKRLKEKCPQAELINDKEKQQFVVRFPRNLNV